MADDKVTQSPTRSNPNNILELISSRKKPENGAKEGEEKEATESGAKVIRDIASWIDHDPLSPILTENHKPFPYTMLVVNPAKVGEPQIIAIDQNNVCYRMSLEELGAEIVKAMDVVSTATGFFSYFCDNSKATRAAKFWRDRKPRSAIMPKEIAFADDTYPAFHRLPFNRPEAAADVLTALGSCPTWSEILGRMGANGGPFCAWVWSLFEDYSDRKQSVYIFGEKDCGKSRVAEALARAMGSQTPGKGAFTVMSSKYIESSWGAAALIGKIFCTVDEAVPKFLGSSLHKSLTGSTDQLAEGKGKDGTSVTIRTKFLFTSNQAPECASRGDTLERLIVIRLLSHGLDRQNLIPDKQYDTLLDSELAPFLSVCRHFYSPYVGGKRILCDFGELQSAMDEFEQFEDSLFNRLFEVDPTSFVSFEEIKNAICHEAAWTQPKTVSKYIKTWKDRFGIRHGRGRISDKQYKGYLGLRRKPLEG